MPSARTCIEGAVPDRPLDTTGKVMLDTEQPGKASGTATANICGCELVLWTLPYWLM